MIIDYIRVMDWILLIINILIVLAAALGISVKRIEQKLEQFKELINELEKALEDEEITKEELKKIISKIKELFGKRGDKES